MSNYPSGMNSSDIPGYERPETEAPEPEPYEVASDIPEWVMELRKKLQARVEASRETA